MVSVFQNEAAVNYLTVGNVVILSACVEQPNRKDLWSWKLSIPSLFCVTSHSPLVKMNVYLSLVYDTQQNTVRYMRRHQTSPWIQIKILFLCPTPPPPPLHLYRSTGFSEVIVVVGGCERIGGFNLPYTECYDPVTGEWKSLAKLPEFTKSEYAVCALRNDILVSGKFHLCHKYIQ